MSLKLFALSFFKTEGIQYYLDHQGNIVFQCPYCKNKAVMNSINSSWECSYCNSIGNIYNLIKKKEENKSSKRVDQDKIFINPKKFRKEINFLLNGLINAHAGTKSEKVLINIKQKFNELYCEMSASKSGL